MAGKEIYIITVCIQLGTNGKSGCGKGEREVKSEKPAVLHSRHKEISSANSALARLASYAYDKAENKCTDYSAELILRLQYNHKGSISWTAAWRFQANNSGLGGTLGVATCHFPGVYAHQTVKWVVKVEFD